MNSKSKLISNFINSSRTPKSTFKPFPKNEFNRECPFHNSTSPLHNNNQHKIENECPGGSSCENYKKIKELEMQIKKLKSTITDLTKLNNYFIFTISQKDGMYRNLLKENTSMKSRYYLFDAQVNFTMNQLDKNDGMRTSYDGNNNKRKTLRPIHKGQKQGMVRSSSVGMQRSSKCGNENEHIVHNSKSKEHKQIGNTPNNEDHYIKIQEISNKNSNNKMQNSSVVSFLSLSNTKLEEIANNENIAFLTQITQSNEMFISKVKNSSKEFLTNFFDVITILMKDYQLIIKLIQRLKTFMTSSVNLIKSVLSSTLTKLLLSNTCDILECEKTNLFLYDSLSNQLIVHSGDAVQNNHLKVPKDEGIVGTVFAKKEKLKIDDAYQDPRFNPEIDRQTNFKTRNMLCFPLLDEHSHAFGAIQAINKKKRHFNQDDEELMNTFTKEISAMLMYLRKNEANASLISRLKILFRFTIANQNVHSIQKFTKNCEAILMSMFMASACQVLFVDEEGVLTHYEDEQEVQMEKEVGIVNYVMKRKEMYCCVNVNSCKLYNTLVDVSGGEGLMTFPIMYGEVCVGIVQTNVNGDINEGNRKINEDVLGLFDMLNESVEMWIMDNKEDFPFFRFVKNEIKSFSMTREVGSENEEESKEENEDM